MGNPLDETSCWTEEVAGERTGIGAIIPKSPFMATKPQEGEDYMKRLLTILMVVVMLFSVVVCASAQMEKGKKIGFVNAGPDDYYAQFGKTLVAVAKSYGMTVTEVNSDYKPEKELANVQDLIAKGVDAIAVITAGAAGSAATIKAANDAKVPIFFIAGKPDLQPGTDFTGHVTDNFVIMGYKIGEWVAKNYPKAKCVDIPGFLGQGPAEGEIVGFDLALKKYNMAPAKLLKSAEWQSTLAVPITQDLVASGTPFDVVFAANEETARGVIQVFEEQGIKNKIIVSNNGKEDAWLWMKQGKMAATVPNPPSLNADLCVQQMVRYFNGEKFVHDLQITPFDVLTKANLDKAIPWDTDTYMKGRAAKKFIWDLGYYEKQYVQNKQMFADYDKLVADYLAAH
jgi:ribose transport system substrate-binding protein